MNRKLGIVITDGVGYRNFILSNFLTEACTKFDSVVIYSGLPISGYNLKLIPKKVVIEELDIFVESKITWVFRKLKETAHMSLHKKFYGINDNLRKGYPKTNSIRSILTRIIYKITSVCNSEKCISIYEYLQFLSFSFSKKTNTYKRLLKTTNPDVLFFTHQRPPYVAPILHAAKRLKIRTSAFIFSWDNLASKGRMMGPFNTYFVWSDLMKKELLYFYPSTKKECVFVVGTPQFEPYVLDKYHIDKAAFFKKFKLDSSKKLICYSCADADIGANDSVHIQSIMHFIQRRSDLNLQLLVRTSPAEDGKRFNTLKQAYPKIRWNIPKWNLTRNDHIESWSQRVPTTEDMVDLKALLKFSDLNINMCSTMSLDFMLFEKPVINTVFGNKQNGLYDDQRFLNFDHYKKVIDSKAVYIAKNEMELELQIEEAIKYPKAKNKYQKALIKLQIGKPLKGTSSRIVEILGTNNHFK